MYLTTPFVGGVGGGEMFDWVADNYLNPAPEAVIRPLLRQILDGTRVSFFGQLPGSPDVDKYGM